jgi:hypothetical protein
VGGVAYTSIEQHKIASTTKEASAQTFCTMQRTCCVRCCDRDGDVPSPTPMAVLAQRRTAPAIGCLRADVSDSRESAYRSHVSAWLARGGLVQHTLTHMAPPHQQQRILSDFTHPPMANRGCCQAAAPRSPASVRTAPRETTCHERTLVAITLSQSAVLAECSRHIPGTSLSTQKVSQSNR